MGLNTIMDHLDESNEDHLCYRSFSNLKNQGVTPWQLVQECRKRGWRCMRVDAEERVYVAKTDTAFAEFKAQHAEGTYREL